MLALQTIDSTTERSFFISILLHLKVKKIGEVFQGNARSPIVEKGIPGLFLLFLENGLLVKKDAEPIYERCFMDLTNIQLINYCIIRFVERLDGALFAHSSKD